MRKFKKGFTIVELVIVIAVIAVLTAVLVPTFIHLTNKANKASDESLVTNLNKALAMREAEQGEAGKNNTMYDAVLDLKEEGYLAPQLVSKSDQKLLWSQKANRFFLNESYNEAEHGKKYNCFHVEESIPSSQEWGIYAGPKWIVDSVPALTVSFDAGEAPVTSINYVRTTGDAQEVVIRTNGGNLTIKAASDKVYHYGKADALDVIAVASSSYHENGSVGYAKIATGRLVVEETAKIDGIYLVANEEGEFDGIKLAVVGGAQLPELARADVSLADGQSKLVVEVQTLQTSEGTDSNPEYVWISKSGSEVSATVSSSDNASDYASHVVENPSQSAAATKEGTTHSATPITDNSVARVNAVGYDTFEGAINAAKDGDSVQLLKDINDFKGIVINNKKFILDLNAKTVTGTTTYSTIVSATNNRIFKVTGNSDITIKNGSVIASGEGTTSKNGKGFYGVLRCEGTSRVVMDGVHTNNYRPYGLSYKVFKGTELVLRNCNVVSQYGGGIEVAGGTVDIEKCSFSQNGFFDHCSTCISVSTLGKVNIINSELTTEASGMYAIYVFSSGGEINIRGGNFTGVAGAVRIAGAPLTTYAINVAEDENAYKDLTEEQIRALTTDEAKEIVATFDAFKEAHNGKTSVVNAYGGTLNGEVLIDSVNANLSAFNDYRQ